LYLSGKPAFFGSYTWPWVDPTGSTQLYILPAKARYDAGTPFLLPGNETLPMAPVITTLVGQPVTGSAIEVTGTGDAGDTVNLYADGGTTPVGSGMVAANGSFDITTSVAFVYGLHTLTATQTDAAGLTSVASPDFAVAVGTHLTEVGNHFFLYDSSGSGPSLKYAGADVVAGEFGSWTPIGAVQTASGYEVAWKAGADLYTVWSTDSNGNYITNLVGAVSGTAAALEGFEPTFGQDLNGDGLIGPSTIGASETLEVVSTYSGQVSFTASTGTLELLHSSGFGGTVAGMTGQDTIDFADIDPTKVQQPIYSGSVSGGTLTVTDGSRIANVALLGNYMASTFVTSSDGHGGTNVVDPSTTGTSQAALLAQPQHA
jgi:hypothetical protein